MVPVRAAAEFAPPALVFRGTEWSSEDVARLAWRWYRTVVDRRAAERSGLLALVMANHPESVALFFGLAALPVHLIALPADPRTWHSSPPVPRGTSLVLTPHQAHLATTAAKLGLSPIVLPAAEGASPMWPAARLPLRSRGTIVFTSGSTGAAKPVCRSFAALMAAADASIKAYGLGHGDGIIATLPLASSSGLVRVLIVGSRLRSRVGLLERFDHRATLALFRSGQYRYWPAVPFMADAVSRALMSESAPPAPRICTVIGERLSAAIFSAFRDRFGVPLRSAYGSTESGPIAGQQDDDVGPDCAGTPMPGVSLLIGDEQIQPARAGEPGRIWVRSPWYADGYGFPPELEPFESRDGWYATRDVGVLDARGRIVLLGRLDDCFKTVSGHLVSPAHIAAVTCRCPGVRDAQAIPVRGSVGMVIGLVVSGQGITAEAIRRHAVQHLPEWSWPSDIRVTSELPRLPGGKVDRAACAALLSRGQTPGQAAVSP